MSTEEVKIYTTFDSFEADQVISTLAYYSGDIHAGLLRYSDGEKSGRLRAVYRNSYGAYDDA